MTSIKRYLFAALALVFIAGGCENLSAPNFNAENLDTLTEDPTRARVSAAVQGLLITTRNVYAQDDNDFVAMAGILGRENYVLDVADPRFVSEMLAGELNAGSPAFGGNYWSRPYENLRLSAIALTAVGELSDDPLAGGMTPAEKQATRGFIQTWRALDLYVIAVTRDENCDGSLGCPITVEDDPEALAPVVGLRALYGEIERLLDDGLTNLQESGADAFPFSLHSGFAGFDSPTTFQQFNRALAARIDVYIASQFGETSKFDEALDNLEDSFMDMDAGFGSAINSNISQDIGVFHVFSTRSGDVTNGLFQPSPDPNFRAHPSFRDSARTQSDPATAITPDARDQRFLDKSRPVDFRTFQAVGSDIGFTLYEDIDAPVPIIRNEELVLLAAEAHIGLNQLPQAQPFLNAVRTGSGGLPAVDLTGMSQEDARSELLYDKKYSLWSEGGHHWIDLRRYDRLDDLPLDCPDADPGTAINCPDTQHVINERYPIPLDEQLARGEG